MFGFFKSRKAVSPEEAEIDRIAVGIAQLLEAQLHLCRSTGKLEDAWAIGYIGGFADAVLQYKGIETDKKGMSIMAIAFEKLFGSGSGFTYLKKYAALQNSGNKAALDGEATAGHEVFSVLNGTRKRALALVAYCQEIKDVEWLGPNGK